LLGPAWIFVSYVPGFVAWIWVLVLDVLAIRESQRLDTGQAIGVLLTTVAALFALFIIIIVLVAVIAAIAAIATGSAHS
jgi:flagellar biosynthesis protein FlhB